MKHLIKSNNKYNGIIYKTIKRYYFVHNISDIFLVKIKFKK